MTTAPPVGSHEWTVADDSTPSCYRCGMVKRPENVRMSCAARLDGAGGWTLSLLVGGCYICRPGDPDAADEGCADCDRQASAWQRQAVGALLNGGSAVSPASQLAQSAPSEQSS